MKIEVKYFARFQEITGTVSELLETKASDISGFLEDIFMMHPGLSQEEHILIALNGEFADPTSALKEGDQVAVLPPVSGG